MKQSYFVVYTFLFYFLSSEVNAINEQTFPDDFLFGVASAAYQVEGAWNTSGKGENIWDRFTHIHPERILDGSNGDITCDSYHKFREDVALLKSMEVQFYRFSLSWSRILPKGFEYKVNPDGIRYYNQLIDLLVENNIVPMITLFHYDLPQPLQDLGGFTNSLSAEWLEEYARIVFEHFGERVKLWITFNQPREICAAGYGNYNKAPGYNSTGIANYMCTHNVLKAHARVYHLYDNNYRSLQKGKVGITLDINWFHPKTAFPKDQEAAERAKTFMFRWLADPIFSQNGDYPSLMKDLIAERCKKEGFPRSRLPKFTEEEVLYIKGTYDFLGVNHYTTMLAEGVEDEPAGTPSFEKDYKVKQSYDPSWPNSALDRMKVVPWGFTDMLKWLKDIYGDLEIFITENGYPDDGELNDVKRKDYMELYLSALLDAIYKHRVNVKGYAAWTLLDSFEWVTGYTAKFGLYQVDFKDPQRTRTPKDSSKYYKDIIKNRKLVFN